MKNPKLVILDTMNFGWNTLDDLLKIISRVDIVTINDEEAELSGEYSLVKAAQKSCKWTFHVVIKKGEHGATFEEKMCFYLQCRYVKFLIQPEPEIRLQEDLQAIS